MSTNVVATDELERVERAVTALKTVAEELEAIRLQSDRAIEVFQLIRTIVDREQSTIRDMQKLARKLLSQ